MVDVPCFPRFSVFAGYSGDVTLANERVKPVLNFPSNLVYITSRFQRQKMGEYVARKAAKGLNIQIIRDTQGGGGRRLFSSLNSNFN